MLPQVIHYCWFSGDPLPPMLQECQNSWKKHLPGYTLRLWDYSSIERYMHVPFLKKALENKKWAFASDYVRLKVLSEQGGIYLDMDVFLVDGLDSLLAGNFWATANNGMVEPIAIGSVAGNPVLKKCLDIYENPTMHDRDFLEIPLVIKQVFAEIGYHPGDPLPVTVGDNLLLPHTVFCPMPFEDAENGHFLDYRRPDTLGIHLWNAAWFDDPFRFFWANRWRKGWRLAFQKIGKKPFQSPVFYKSLLYHLFRQLRLIGPGK